MASATAYPQVIGKRFQVNPKKHPFMVRKSIPLPELTITSTPFSVFGKVYYMSELTLDSKKVIPYRVDADQLLDSYHAIEPQLVVSIHDFTVDTDRDIHKLIVAVNQYDQPSKSLTRKVSLADIETEFDKNFDGCVFRDINVPISSFSNINQNVLFKDATCEAIFYVYLHDLRFMTRLSEFITPHTSDKTLQFSFNKHGGISRVIKNAGFIRRSLEYLEYKVLLHAAQYLYDIPIIITEDSIKQGFLILRYLLEHKSSKKIEKITVRKTSNQNTYNSCYKLLMKSLHLEGVIDVISFEIKPLDLKNILSKVYREYGYSWIMDTTGQFSSAFYLIRIKANPLYVDYNDDNLPLSQAEIAQFLKPKF